MNTIRAPNVRLRLGGHAKEKAREDRFAWCRAQVPDGETVRFECAYDGALMAKLPAHVGLVTESLLIWKTKPRRGPPELSSETVVPLREIRQLEVGGPTMRVIFPPECDLAWPAPKDSKEQGTQIWLRWTSDRQAREVGEWISSRSGHLSD